MSDPKQPFVPQGDRPEMELDPEAPIAQLKVRDLSVILNSHIIKIIRDHKWLKPEKYEKIEKFEKIEKWEKFEKIEKPEKLEFEVFQKIPEHIPDPGPLGDPVARRGLEEVVQQIAGLSQQVGALAKQVEDLQKKLG